MGKYLDETGLALLWQSVKSRIASETAGKQDKTSVVTRAGEVQSHTLADGTEYLLTGVGSLSLSYPAGNFAAWISLSVRADGAATVSFPAGTVYIGSVPSFEAGGLYEISVKNRVVVIGKAAVR